MSSAQTSVAGGGGSAPRWAAALAPPQGGVAPDWLRELRERAVGSFRAGGLPHRKVEAWKYAPMQALRAYDLAPAEAAARPQYELPAPLCERAAVIDILDGAPMMPQTELPAGLTLLPLATGIERFEATLRPLFEAVDLAGPARAFAALNTALADQGLVVHLTAGADGGTLLLRWASAPGAGASIRPFRMFLLLEAGSRLELVEQFQSVASSAAGLNVLAQAELGERAALRHVRAQAESGQAVVLTSMALTLARDSRYQYRGFDLGAGLARHELLVRLAGAGAVADLAGACVLDGQRYADHHVCVEHLAPNCRSEQFFRGVLGGRSRGVFNGRALIQAGADGSSVRQSSANLLLSPLAEMDTKPELEIYADEVEASHGATVGQLDENAVFYLRSRGLDDGAARRILTTAFCRAVTDRVERRGLAERIGELVDAAMPVKEAD